MIKKKLFVQKILSSIKFVIGKKTKKLHDPIFRGKEKKYLNNCINTGYVSYVGKYVSLFEKKISNYTKSKNVVSIINGTCALHILLKYFNIGVNDEVLIPSQTFVATANAISYCNATPHFVDTEIQTLGICPDKLENYLKRILIKKNKFYYNKKTGRRVKVLIAVHVFGVPCQILKLKSICAKFNITLIEDAAEAIGSFYKKIHLGNFALASVISFNGNKTITCGGGAVIITKSKKLAETIKHQSTTAKINHPWEYIHNEIGYNYRMTNLNAAVGCAQLENINKIIAAKRKNFNKYQKEFLKNRSVEVLREPKFSKSNYWLIALKLKKQAHLKNLLLKESNKIGIKCRPIWKPLHTLKMFKSCPKDNLTNTIKTYKEVINLPSSPALNYK